MSYPDPGPILHSGPAPRRRPALSGRVLPAALPAASSGKMAARDRRARRGSEAEAGGWGWGGRGTGTGPGSRPPAALTCQRRRRPAADRRSPGARRPRHTRTGREGGAGAGARPARTSGGGRHGAGWRRAAAAPSRFGPENVSTSRLRCFNAPSRSHENTQLPLPGLDGSPAPRARDSAHSPAGPADWRPAPGKA